MSPFDPRLPIIALRAKVKTCHVYHCFMALREMGRQFHPTAFATFAGLEERHVTAILAALEAEQAVPQGRTTSTRGHRLALDFSMPQDWIDWAIAKKHWHPDDVAEEAENFVNFWHAKPGSDACKLDWKKTWQVWVNNSRRQNGDYYPSQGPTLSHEEHMERTAALYDRMGRANEAEEIRRRLRPTANVIPFNHAAQKMAQNGG